MLAVPVRWREQRIGVLEAVHRDANAFREEDLQILETAATWTAIAISNARQYERLQRRLGESDAIAAVTHALTETLELDEVMQLITGSVQQVVANADWTTIHLLSPDSNQLVLPGQVLVQHARNILQNIPDQQYLLLRIHQYHRINEL